METGLKLEKKLKRAAEAFKELIEDNFKMSVRIWPHDKYCNDSESLTLMPVDEIDWKKFDRFLKNLAEVYGVRASRYSGYYDTIIII